MRYQFLNYRMSSHVPLAGFEPATFRLGSGYSHPLSYKGMMRC